MTEIPILPELGGKAANYCFRSGPALDPLHVTTTPPDTYSLDVVRFHANADGSLRYEHLEVMRMRGDEGREYMADATEKFNRMLAEVGPDHTERAAKTWGHLLGAFIQPWREVSEDELLRDRVQVGQAHELEIE